MIGRLPARPRRGGFFVPGGRQHVAVEKTMATKFAKCCHQRCHGEKSYRGNFKFFGLSL
jgi:hypothetical protein